MRQQWDRYDQERVLELERKDRAILDAEERVRGLEENYRTYENRKTAAEVRLREQSNQPSDDADARPSVAPVPAALPDTSRADPPYLHELPAEFSECRNLRKFDPALTMQEFADFMFYLEVKREGTKRS